MTGEGDASWHDTDGEEMFNQLSREFGVSERAGLAVKLRNEALELKRRNKLKTAMFLMRKCMSTCHSVFADSIAEAGTVFFEAQNHKRAMKLWCDALQLHHPHSLERGDVLQFLAAAHDEMGEYDLANRGFLEAHGIYERCGKGPEDAMYQQLIHKWDVSLRRQEQKAVRTLTQEDRSEDGTAVERQEAEKRAQEIFEMMFSKQGRDNKYLFANLLHKEAFKLREMRRPAAAAFMLEHVIEASKVNYSDSIFDVAAMLYEVGDYVGAVGVWLCALLLHPVHCRESADILQHIAGAHDELGKFDLAEEQYQEAYDIYQTCCRGCKEGGYPRLLQNWALFLKKQERFSEAWPKLLQAGVLWRSTGGHEEDFAKHLHEMGDLFQDLGRWNEAESFYREALEKKRNLVGEEHSSYGKTLSNLSTLLQAMGRYREAAELQKKGARIRELRDQDNELLRAIGLQNEGSLLQELGQFGRAVECFDEALRIRLKELGQESLDYAVTLSSLGHAMMDMAKYEEAEEMLKKAIGIKDAVVGCKHSSHVTSCINLGHLYHRMGAYERASHFFDKAMDVCKEMFGEEHPYYIDRLGEFAHYKDEMGELEEAENIWRRKLEKDRRLRPNHVCCSQALMAIAKLRWRAGCPQEAMELLEEQKLKVAQTPGLGREHFAFAELLSQLATLYDAVPTLGGNAEPLLREAVETLRATYGEGHPEHLDAVCRLACNACLRGEDIYALKLLEQVHVWKMRTFYAMLPVLPEHRRLLFLQNMQEEAQLCPWVALQGQTCSSEVAQQCFGIAAVQKGLIYQVQWAMARACKPSATSASKVEERLDQTRAELIKAVFGTNPCRGAKTVDILLEEFEECEVKLGKQLRSSPSSPFADLRGSGAASLLENVANKLPSKCALAEYITYCGPLGADTCYGVFVIPTRAHRLLPGGVTVHLLGLGSATDLNDRVHQLFEIFQALPQNATERELDKEEFMQQEGEFQKYAGELRKQILDPVLAVAGEDLEHLFISPDGELWQVPFEALPLECKESRAASEADGEGHQNTTRFVMDESFTLSYLSSSKDLFPDPHMQKTDGEAAIETDHRCVVFANPDFDLHSSHPGSTDVAPPVRNTFSETGQWKDLEGLRDESFMVQKVMENAGYKVQLVEGQKATAEELKKVARPPLLHIASHGYVIFGDGKIGGSKRDSLGKLAPLKMLGLNKCLQPLEHPFFRGGLALAGARAWQRAIGAGAPLLPTGSSGHITALECCALDLMGTRHVTLSACDMARGESWSGQGVMSMGRAFQMAGAESVLVSLWQVDDKSTPRMMNQFYELLFDGLSRAAAFREAQRSLRRNGKPLRIWASFVLHGQPGPIVT